MGSRSFVAFTGTFFFILLLNRNITNKSHGKLNIPKLSSLALHVNLLDTDVIFTLRRAKMTTISIEKSSGKNVNRSFPFWNGVFSFVPVLFVH